jgi:acyl-CoA synthetase (NDP forming)
VQNRLTGTDRAWCDDLLLALRLRDVPGTRIGEVIAEVQSHVAETGEDPRQAFGTPKEYAAEVAGALGYPVVLKVLSPDIAHKSDVGGVKVGVPAADIPAACATMLEDLRRAGAPEPEGFLVQELVRGSAEVILGFHRDPQLGPAVLLGMGGVAAELFRDTAMRLLPLGRADAEAMLRELKTWPLLDGFRGAPRCDVAALVDAILGFAAMAAALGDRLVEAEINPVFVLPEGQGVRAVDGLAILT